MKRMVAVISILCLLFPGFAFAWPTGGPSSSGSSNAPIATSSSTGVVKPDNTTIGVDGSGTVGVKNPLPLNGVQFGFNKGLFNVFYINDPAAPPTATLAGAGAGNLSNGTYQYDVYFITAQGPGLVNSTFTTASITVTDNSTNGKVLLTNIPISSDPAVVARGIVRTLVNGSVASIQGCPGYYLTTINDNTTTTFLDNISDTTLSATPIDIWFNINSYAQGGIYTQVGASSCIEAMFSSAGDFIIPVPTFPNSCFPAIQYTGVYAYAPLYSSLQFIMGGGITGWVSQLFPPYIGEGLYQTDIGGAANTYAIAVPSTGTPFPAYAGDLVNLAVANTNTGSSTFNGTAIVDTGGNALTAGMMQAGHISQLQWDGTNWELLNPYRPAGITASGTSCAVTAITNGVITGATCTP